jgi:exosortase
MSVGKPNANLPALSDAVSPADELQRAETAPQSAPPGATANNSSVSTGDSTDHARPGQDPLSDIVNYGPADSLTAEPVWGGLRISTWMKIGVVAALFISLFWANLHRLWGKTNPINGDPNWGHAICIPFVGLYYLYVNREELLAASARSKPSIAGLFIMVLGILLFGYGIWPGQNDFVKDFGMVVTLFGVTLLLAGWPVMKIAWFPIAFLVCGIPWPGLVYSSVAGPLQQLAAQVAVGSLSATGVKSFASGTKIFIMGHDNTLRTLNVAEACAGLRSLMTFISVAAAIAFLSARPLWEKIVITISAIPIAIFCNVMRVSGQGLLDHYVSQQLSESFAHQFVGMIMLIPAFFLILGVGWVVDQLVLDELDVQKGSAAQVIRRGANGSSAPRAIPSAPRTIQPTPPPSLPRLMTGVVRPAGPTPALAGGMTPAPTAGNRPRIVPAPPAPNSVLASHPRPTQTPQAKSPPTKAPPAKSPSATSPLPKAVQSPTPAPAKTPGPRRPSAGPPRAISPQEMGKKKPGNSGEEIR